MKRSQTVHLTLVASLASLLTSCNQRATRYCVDQNQNVADDQKCEFNYQNYHWYYVHRSGSAGVGTHLSGGSVTPPAEGFVSRSGSGDAESGSARGGIGAAGEAASGHGASGSAGE